MMFVVSVLIVVFGLGAAEPQSPNSVQDTFPFVWKIKTSDPYKLFTAKMGSRGCALSCECTHNPKNGLELMIYTGPFGRFSTVLGHGQTEIEYFDMKTKSHSQAIFSPFVTGFCSKFGRVTFSPPDAAAFDVRTELQGGPLPALFWMCEGHARGTRLTQFIFRVNQDKVAFVSADFLWEFAPKVLINWGTVEEDLYDRRHVLHEQTFDFSESAIFNPRTLSVQS